MQTEHERRSNWSARVQPDWPGNEYFFFFFFQAEDGIRDKLVTGVQTCALPIFRFVVGFPPGGSADPTTRILAAALQEQLGQPVVVENRPGADSAIAAEQITRAAPDGYTIFFGSNSAMTAAVALRKQAAYDPLKDFTPISLVGRATIFFYVHPS